jgi:imidazolonepropionase-like amidohydrolase
MKVCSKKAALLALMMACSPLATADTRAFIGGTLIDGTRADPIVDAVVVVQDGRITAAGPAASTAVPENAERIDIAGKYLLPGLINTHGHVGDVRGLEGGHYSTENLLRQLSLYANYGITTVVSLGGDAEEGFALRDSQNTPELDRSRLFVAGSVLNATSPAEARAAVDRQAAANPDFIKIRVDDFLGRGRRMTPTIYGAFAEQADAVGIPLAVHIFYQEDAIGLLEVGADYIGHSIRDEAVSDAFINLIKERDVCYSPTLTREISTFIYEDEPEFFSDPFFLREADPAVLDILREPERQRQMRDNPLAQGFKAALPTAMDNLNTLAEAGVRIAMGTDSGPAARFQGYFEHLEMWMMADAGMSAEDILFSATGGAAACMGLQDVGTVSPGHWADLIVLGENPLEDIRNTRSLEQVWIAGNPVMND